MLYAIPSPTDRIRSRQAAQAVAEKLGTKAVSDRQVVLGEPQCHYAIRTNSEHFWFGARFSPDIYVVKGTHKRIASLVPPFYVSLKAPYRPMLTNVKLPSISRELGVAVFVSEIAHGPIASEMLSAPEIRGPLEQLDFRSIDSAFVSPLQLHVVGSFSDISHTAEQIKTQRVLLENLYMLAMPPNPALHTDAPGLSRPLQLSRKGRASLQRAGKRER